MMNNCSSPSSSSTAQQRAYHGARGSGIGSGCHNSALNAGGAGNRGKHQKCNCFSGDGLQHRHMSTGTATASVAAPIIGPMDLKLPPGSTADVLMQRCIEQAGESGFVTETYDPWTNVDLVQTLIISLVDNFGISWFTAIMVSSVLLRLVTFPLAVRGIRGSREKSRARPEFDALFKLQQEAINDKSSKKAAGKQEEVRNQMDAFQKKYGSPYFFPFKGTWPIMLVQVPLYLTVFRSMKGFADHPHLFPDLALESPLWLESLALPDPTYVLPSISVGLMLLNLQLYGSLDAGAESLNSKKHDNESLQKWAPYIVRASVFLILPFSGGMPSAVFVYMATNTVVVGLQNMLLKLPSVEAFLEFPKLSTKEDEEKIKKVAMQKPLYAWQDSLGQPRKARRKEVALEHQNEGTDAGSESSSLKQLSSPALFHAVVPRDKIRACQAVDETLVSAIDSRYRITRKI